MSQRFIFQTLLQTLSTDFDIDRCVVITRTRDTETVWRISVQSEHQLQSQSYAQIPLTSFAGIPQVMLKTVLGCQGAIVINDLTDHHPFRGDPYWQSRSPRHLLCLPLTYDKQLLGAIYIEKQSSTPGDDPAAPHTPIPPWSNSQIRLIKGICCQAAISLKHLEAGTPQPTAHEVAIQGPSIKSSEPLTPTWTIPVRHLPCPNSEEFHAARTFQQLVENANDVIFMITIDGRFSYLSPKFQDMVGFAPQDYINKSFTHLTHPDDLPRMYRMLKLQLLKRQQNNEFEFRLRRQDGSYFWAAANNSAPLEDEYGNLIGFQGIIRDINTRKLAEQALQQAQARLHFLVATTPAIIHSISLKPDARDPGTHQISFISENVEAILGYQTSQFMGSLSNWAKRIHPQDRHHIFRLYCNTIRNQGECQAEYRLRNNLGTYQWLYSAMKVLVDANGVAIEAVGYTADITPRRLAEDRLIKTNEQLQISNSELARATRLKDEFLANMSHELRTPLNAILGISEAVLDEVYGPLSGQYRKSLKIIEQSGQHLLELINDILDLAKIEANKLAIKPSNTSLKYLCESSLSFVRQTAINKVIQLKHDGNYGEDYIYVDERRMRQVLINLLSNAVKFTPGGGCVELNTQYDAITKRFQFQIKDNGIGIAPDDLPQLFQPFIQIDSNLSRQFSGTGLGLTLVKRIVNLHNGTISVESTENSGSCFTVELPITPLRNPEVPQPSLEVWPPKVIHREAPLILLAEDNAMNIEILTDYLNAQGYQVLIAQNGLEAIEINCSKQPQLILMDIQMPQMDGLEATRQIRRDPSACGQVPIIALTALAMPGDADRCLKAGANDYLAKPVKLKQLATIVDQHLAACYC
ncbi:PAS domain-containing protein [filamentous cyanobacterium LEGE 11480]|uniref:histidine kinase n=1 Tax=Romeriopsis navalis LEGE 11480 TaxID=2777977 RepID=A0A928VNA4_9CYAN|nr:PAS domain-containing protein [Romeriopsis navalis]MBE9030818.1 PAS domain-containing protein [Romeriopsis navalis LEGE 11480]